MRTQARNEYCGPIGLEIDGWMSTDLADVILVLLALREECAKRGDTVRTRDFDRVIVHAALGLAERRATDPVDALARRDTIGDLKRWGLEPNAFVNAMLEAALSKDVRPCPSTVSLLPTRAIAFGAVGDTAAPGRRPKSRCDVGDLLVSKVSTKWVPAQAMRHVDVGLIAEHVVIRPARVLSMSLTELVAKARALDREVNKLHASGNVSAAYTALHRTNLVSIVIAAWDVRTGHEAVERLEYLTGFPGLFEAEDNLTTMLRAVVTQDALDWGITIHRGL